MPEPMRDPRRPGESFAASLFREYAEGLHRFLRRKIALKEDADDLCQTVFERLSKTRREELVEKPHEYLFGIAFNVLREFRIRERRRDELLAVDSEAVEAADESLEHAHADVAAERTNLRQQLERALAQLPDIHRRVLLACKRDGMTYEEAALATGISVDMVHKILTQARAKMMAIDWDR